MFQTRWFCKAVNLQNEEHHVHGELVDFYQGIAYGNKYQLQCIGNNNGNIEIL